jgi:hypothetical protein
VTLLAGDAGATAAAGGARLAALTWDVGPLLGLLWDNVTASASQKGYALTRSELTPALATPTPLGAGALLTLAPLAAAVNITILLPLSATYVTTLLTERVPWTQLVANVVGLSGILGVFGTLFGHCEKRLGRRAPAQAAPAEAAEKGAGAAGASAAALSQLQVAIAALRRDVNFMRLRPPAAAAADGGAAGNSPQQLQHAPSADAAALHELRAELGSVQDEVAQLRDSPAVAALRDELFRMRDTLFIRGTEVAALRSEVAFVRNLPQAFLAAGLRGEAPFTALARPPQPAAAPVADGGGLFLPAPERRQRTASPGGSGGWSVGNPLFALPRDGTR